MGETFRYLVGGVTLESDLPLPALAGPAPGEEPAPLGLSPPTALRLHEGPVAVDPGAPWLVERRLADGEQPYLRVRRTPEGYLLAHASGLRLAIGDSGRDLVLDTTDASLTAADLEHLLLDQLLPLVIARLGRLSLHASAIARGGRAAAFLAPSGTGKSTTAAALSTRPGTSFLADDQVVLEPAGRGFLAHPSYPSVRLWGDSARAVFGHTTAVVEHKERVPVGTASGAVPVSVIALLESGETLRFETLRPRDALVAIATHVDRLDPTDRGALRHELELMTKLARETTTMRVVLPRDLDSLSTSVDRLIDTLFPSARASD